MPRSQTGIGVKLIAPLFCNSGVKKDIIVEIIQSNHVVCMEIK